MSNLTIVTHSWVHDAYATTLTLKQDNPPITTYTSFLFALVTYVAYCKNKWLLGALWHVVYGLSILNHSTHYHEFAIKKEIKFLDIICAHMAVLVSIWLALTKRRLIHLWSLYLFWSGLIYTILVYYIAGFSNLPNNQWEPWHASLHIVGAMCETAFILGM